MRDRKEILMDLVMLNRNLPEILLELSEYEWDSDQPLVMVGHSQVLDVLCKYIKNEINCNILEDWANAIECREDLDFESESLKDAIYRIANPVLYGINTSEKVEKIINNIKTDMDV